MSPVPRTTTATLGLSVAVAPGVLEDTAVRISTLLLDGGSVALLFTTFITALDVFGADRFDAGDQHFSTYPPD
jgi:hypothetical protein